MGKSCCQTPEPDPNAHTDPRWRSILWIALLANTAMFVVEIVAEIAANSRALRPTRSMSSATRPTTLPALS